ncbi:MAG: hypothetical protein PVH68_13410 [Armatimonadota bacterium]|jgi:hypothetical protein
MRFVKVLLLATACLAIVHRAIAQPAEEAERPMSALVYPGADGRLVYVPDEEGNCVPNFSDCGYMGGGVRIPDVPVRATLEPAEDDDGGRIQRAIDRVAELPADEDGFRGAVLLKRGTYQIAGTLRIAHSGIVLRGEGQGEDGTVLVAAGTGKRTLITIAGEDKRTEAPKTRRRIAQRYVPVGARTFRVARTKGLEVGDAIIVRRPSTRKWIHYLGMDRIPPKRDGGRVVQWRPGSKDLAFDRVITAIERKKITIDAPVCNAFQRKYGGGYLYRYDFPGRISQVGVEYLRGVSEYKHETDEDHAWSFIGFRAVANAWVRQVTAEHFGYSAVGVSRRCKWITIEDCECLDPISKIAGSRRYSFALTGELTLVQRCYARHGRHDFVMHSVVPGPNVFLDCTAEKAHSDTGPHHRWATATLFDNVRVEGNAINVRNRGNSGTGHGWAGAQMVFWNCTADGITCQKPPTAQNWAIGCSAQKQSGDGYWECSGQPVQPRSLYLAQLRDRLGPQAVANISRPAMPPR